MTHPFAWELINILNRQYGHTGAHFDAIVEDFIEQALRRSGSRISTAEAEWAELEQYLKEDEKSGIAWRVGCSEVDA